MLGEKYGCSSQKYLSNTKPSPPLFLEWLKIWRARIFSVLLALREALDMQYPKPAGYPVPNLNQTFPKIKKYHTENPPHTYFRSIKKWGWVSSVLPGILREITNKLSQYLVKESLTLKIALTLPRQHKDCIRFIGR